METRRFARSPASCDMISAFSGGRLWLRCDRLASVAGFKLIEARFLIADIKSECGSEDGAGRLSLGCLVEPPSSCWPSSALVCRRGMRVEMVGS